MSNNCGGDSANLATVLDTKSIFDDDFNCQYEDIDSMYENSEGKFTVLSQNVRSLGGKFDLLREYLGRQKGAQITCLALQEVWSIARNYELPGYHPFEYNTRDKNKTLNSNCGGGVGFFISNSLDYEVIQFKDEFVEGVYESIWVQLKVENGRSKVLGCVYRPNTARGDLKRAIAIHKSILQEIKSNRNFSNSDLMVFSDFNVDLLNYHTHAATADYVDFQLELGLLPLITLPTRKYHTTATLIDHIFATKTENFIKVGVLEDSEISDHFGTAYIENLQVSKRKAGPIQRREITKEATSIFSKMAASVDWDVFATENDDQKYYSNVLGKIDQLVGDAFPLQNVVPKSSRITPPWFSKGLAESSKHKRKLFAKSKKNPSPQNVENYKNYQKHFQRVLRKAKADFYNKQFDKYACDVKETWRVLRQAIGYNKKGGQKFPDYFLEEVMRNSGSEHSGDGLDGGGDVDDASASALSLPTSKPSAPFQPGEQVRVTDKEAIAEGFNKFFSTVGTKLADKIRGQNARSGAPFEHTTFVKKSSGVFSFQWVDTNTILKTIQHLKNKGSSGVDGISNVLLKVIAPYIIKPLYKVFNRSLRNGTVPDSFKIAKIIPIYKGRDAGSQHEYTNYRPISLLQSLSKVLEKLVDSQLRRYLKYQNILYSKQFGFRGRRGCDQALLLFTDFAQKHISVGNKVLTAFLDLKKAFDTVDHEILLQKLTMYGVGGVTNDWFRDYLRDRKQSVKVPSGEKSELKKVNLGVPQGSVLGPLLFLLYMNDLAFCVPEFQTILFADDTSLSLAGQNYNQLLVEFNQLLGRVSDWLRVNLLSLNVSKTKYMLFKQKRENIDHLGVFINGEEIARVGKGLKQETYKYLGVLIGEDLTFSEHVDRIKGKLISASFMLNQSKNFLPFKARLQVYRSLFESHLNFASIVWSINPNAISKLGSIQQKALRYIFLKPRRSHVTPLLSAHNLLKVDQLITSVRAKFIQNLRTGRLPDEFNDFVKMVNVYDENARNLRFANFNYNLDTDKSSAKYFICKSWNSLPFNLKSEQPDEFLEELRQYFKVSNDEECQVEKCWLCGHD